jgi:carbonic anhydrase/acetyltransferase-like protein (isoleucine patch superfamily)
VGVGVNVGDGVIVGISVGLEVVVGLAVKVGGRSVVVGARVSSVVVASTLPG